MRLTTGRSASATQVADTGQHGNDPSRWRIAALAAAVLLAVVTAAQLVELAINRILRPNLEEWTWISEVLVVMALLVLTASWARLRVARTAIAALERERLIIHAELAVAANVQRALLPPPPATGHGITWHAAMEPAGEIGGDYYDFFATADGRMCVVVGDVSGKGVPAAVFVSNTRAVVRAVAREAGATPGVLLAAVSQILFQDRSSLYVTCLLGIVDLDEHTMVYTNAGHPPGLVRGSAGEVRGLTVGGPPLGLFADAAYDEGIVVLNAGDLVVFVSDGITEAIDASGDGVPVALAAEFAGTDNPTPERACNLLLDTARRSSGPHGVPQWADDRTVVAFAYRPDSSRH